MHRHFPLLLLMIALLLFSLFACDTKPGEVDVGGGGVVMNPGSTTTTTSGTGGSQPDQPEEGGGVDLPYLPA